MPLADTPPEWNPGEAMLAVLGILDIIEKREPAIMHADMYAVDVFETKIKRLARQLGKGNLDRPYKRMHVSNYQKTLVDLTTPPDASYFTKIVNRLPDHAGGHFAAFIPVASNAMNYLVEKFPLSVKPTITGPKNLTPPDMLIGAFECILTVVEDPLVVFDLIRTARLQIAQKNAIRDVYPVIYDRIGRALYDVVIAGKAAKRGYECPFAQGLATFLGVPAAQPEFAAALAQSQQETRDAQAKRQQMKGATITARSRAAGQLAPASQKQEVAGT